MNTYDKSSWGEGPWQNEPDELSFDDDGTELPCRIVRNLSGALCGYVGISVDHPLHSIHYTDVGPDLEVHGGLTFSGELKKGCELWWFGFDCAHYGDYSPAMAAFLPSIGPSIYRRIEYVKGECASLAHQLDRVAKTQKEPPHAEE